MRADFADAFLALALAFWVGALLATTRWQTERRSRLHQPESFEPEPDSGDPSEALTVVARISRVEGWSVNELSAAGDVAGYTACALFIAGFAVALRFWPW